MVKTNRRSSLATTDRSSMNASSNYADNTFCVVLHVVEAINFYGREMRDGERDQIVMNAALNTVDFEVEGTPSVTTETIIFNSNCIWECDMAGIKRIKTDHRPVKVTFFACSNSQRKTIGSLLLPIRGIPVLGLGGNNSALQLKMFWHKLICISNEFRSHKPEVLLMLTIIKKTLLHTKEFKHLMVFNSTEKQPRVPPLQSPGHSITANMLQSQANVYVQSLVQLGLLQVGNNPLVDCDIIEVVLQFKQLKNLNKFVKSVCHGKDVNVLLLMFDFVGNITNIELKLDESDCYTLDDVLGLRFKSSLRSIRLYFQRIFYLPINMYINGTSIANYRMDFGKLLPSDKFFADKRKYTQSGSFSFERFGRMASARELKPIMDYTFSVDIQEVCWRQQERSQVSNPQVSQQCQEDQVDMQDQLSLNCVGSKAVIHEVPKDRINESVGDWQNQMPDEETQPEVVSVNSLNVGAELSDLDERESILEAPLSDDHDSDAPKDDKKIQLRRKKYTRLLEMEMEQDEANLPYLPEDVESETEVLGIYSNSKFCPENSNADEEHMVQKTKQYSRRSVEEEVKPKLNSAREKDSNDAPVERQSLKSNKNRNRINPETPIEDEQKNQVPIKRSARKSKVNEYEFFEENIGDSSSQLGHENEKMSLKSSRPKHIVKEMKKSKTTPIEGSSENLKDFQTAPNLQEVNKQSKAALKNNLQKDDSFVTETKIIHKKKSVSNNEEFKLLEAAEMAKIVNKSEKDISDISQNRYLMSDDSFLEVEKDLEIASQLERAVRKPRKRIVKEPVKDIDTTTDTEKQEEPIARKTKPNLLLQVESEFSETVVVKKPKQTKKVVSRTDLSLSARWVEVNKNQVEALEETERYIQEISAEQNLNDTSYERQFSARKSSRRKPERENAYLSSEMDNDTSLTEEHLVETKVERKVLKKKTSRVEPIAENELRSTTKLVKKVVNLKNVPSVESELTEQEESSCSQSPATKSRKPSKQEILELRNTPREQPENRRTVKTVPSELTETESSEMEARKRRLKKKLIRVVPNPEDERSNPLKSPKNPNNSQLDSEAQVSRLEVTVHMYDQSKGTESETKTKSTNPDINESLKQILEASMELKDDMQLKALEYLRNLKRQTVQISMDKKSQTPPEKLVTTDADYAFRFQELEQHIVVLENHLHQFENRTLEMQKENSKLTQEKMQLKQRINHMEQQILELLQHTKHGGDLKQVLAEIRQQNVRFEDVSKAKDRYKKEWRRAAKRIHDLKLAMYEKNVQMEYKKAESNVLNLKSILTQDAVEFEREYGRYRKSKSGVSFSASGDSSEPLLKDYLRVLSHQTVDKHKPSNQSQESSRMH